MTCIVGYISGNKTIYMGGDRAAVNQFGIQKILTEPKVYFVDNFVIGFCGSLRFGQVVRYSFTPPEKPEGMSLMGYMCGPFVTTLRTVLEEQYPDCNEDSESGCDGSLLVGTEGRLFGIDSSFAVLESNKPYLCIGSGEYHANSALEVLQYLNNKNKCVTTPEHDIELALSLSALNCCGVARPFDIAIYNDVFTIKTLTTLEKDSINI